MVVPLPGEATGERGTGHRDNVTTSSHGGNVTATSIVGGAPHRPSLAVRATAADAAATAIADVRGAGPSCTTAPLFEVETRTVLIIRVPISVADAT